MKRHVGEVYFVGAGPGDPKLLTLRGAELLQEADVIVYDRLVNIQLLDHAKKGAELIYCGKQPQTACISQEEINDILVYHGKRGQKVVRLKGGDSTVFGRVGEEAAACRQNGLPFEIVPGITSGIAAPAYAGIPLTHRELSSSFAVVAGHRRKDGKQEEINWQSLAVGVDTLVFYMGVKQIQLIQEKLLLHGRPPSTPVAIIQWGTCEVQKTVTGELGTIVKELETKKIASPAIIVVGEVVRLREDLAWFEDKLADSPLLQQAIHA
ncbi:uroporphyrinogen-III C-methyltransferase [Salipaludibacillus keqinensis]|uniref:Uroporphyrinogen-III C-methyltransferase n=1 Tax=Salipaludibacillus keqinensis TaxID=2045207 RepID=A0A323T6G3_9BACI|nr:uroporphyrinogen-III C-methyltransferase [Salipaludibacillus keqinensis]PYZ91721.1 uroporphyrinogen-III C-methyltransferase [Salipaludibacillus keqinensis]